MIANKIVVTGKEQIYILMYKEDTYGMNLPREISSSLREKGIVEWLPYNQWSGQIWGLTKRGLKVQRIIRHMRRKRA